MFKNAVVAWVFSAAALIAWSFAFWLLVVPPLHLMPLLPSAPDLSRRLQQENLAPGTYFAPHAQPSGTAAPADASPAPFYRLSFSPRGERLGSAPQILMGAAQQCLVALLAVLLLALAAAPGFLRRFLIVLCAGAVGTVFIAAADPVWLQLPWDGVFGAAIYQAGAWLLLGLIAGGVMRPPEARTPAPTFNPAAAAEDEDDDSDDDE
ncbi:MAG: hypothetical protein ACREJ2_03395 [Planctomycetota bacterium]